MNKLAYFMNKQVIILISLLLVTSLFLIFENSSARVFSIAPMPDLTFTNLTYNISFISTNTTTSITYWNVRALATLKNTGTAPVGNSTSSISVGISSGGTGYGFGYGISTPPIPAGASIILLESFVASTGQGHIRFDADFFNNITELNELNNIIGINITLP